MSNYLWLRLDIFPPEISYEIRQGLLHVAAKALQQAINSQGNRKVIIDARESIDEIFRMILEADALTEKSPEISPDN